MLKNRFKGKQLCSKLIRNISKNALNYLLDEVGWAVECGSDKSKRGCLMFITYGLSSGPFL
jgi:secreted Zn-dependent insulinase-like peptidase